jgi:hypothetical protein
MMIKKWMFSLACLLLCTSVAGEAQTLSKLFTDMPDSLCTLLTAINRADCIDFLDSKMKAEVTNRLGGRSEMTALTDNYIQMQLTGNSSWELKLLPLNDSTNVICSITTVSAPAPDSSIRFYDTHWKELSAETFLQAPRQSDFISVPDTLNSFPLREAFDAVNFCLLRADLSKEQATLTFTFTTPDTLTPEAAALIKPYVHAPLCYEWEQGRFRRKE